MYEYLDRRYALALYKAAEEKGKVQEYLSDLEQVVQLCKENVDIINIIKHPQVSTARKRQIFTSIFKGKMDDGLLSFLLILIDKGRILHIEEKLREMKKIHLDKNHTLLAEIKTVVPLLECERNDLIIKLEKKYNKKIILDENIDESIIGGVYVRVGDDVIDATLKTKLYEMKKMVLK